MARRRLFSRVMEKITFTMLESKNIAIVAIEYSTKLTILYQL